MYMQLLMAFRQLMAKAFAGLFFLLSVVLMGIAGKALLDGLLGNIGLTDGYLRAINMAVVALAMFELGLVVIKEYATESKDDVLTVLRRTVPRFVAMVSIALVLEALLMVIKYSQLELAGNLPYPVAIIASTALLLLGLGGFLRFSEGAHPEPHPVTTPELRPAATMAHPRPAAQPGCPTAATDAQPARCSRSTRIGWAKSAPSSST